MGFNIKDIIIIRESTLLTSFIIIIKSYIEKNYNFSFRETNESQVILDDINVKMKINNYKLEESLEKLKERQHMYKDFLNYLSSPVIIINEKYRIIYSNKEFSNIVGKNNVKSVINKKLNNLIKLDFDFNEIKDNEILNKYATNFKNNKMEVDIINLGNKYEKDKYILLFKDLSEERKIVEMKQKLENNKMRETLNNNFLSGIYHDLKTPVNIIYSAAQLEEVLIENNDIAKLQSYNNISKANCITLTQLTNNLIDKSKIDCENINANMEFGNIVEFIEDYLVNLTDYIENNNINLLFDTEEEEIFIYFDKEIMMRIILNLISNSLSFTDVGGEIEILIKSEKEKVVIEFSDTRVCMSEEFMKNVFSKYEIEKKEDSSGFDVGLFIVYNLVKVQEGDIEIKSNLNNGTTFIISLNK
ncbi:ATP-binding protein [Clostridium sp.]|uniref:sensor histidine kinase n=1 Tax=Clostridium sp. TaxID=1506 RepID=UPI002616E016|nr:ATP-binding protein [Clostridium sp.]